jgi:hypothetical protein
MNFSRGVLAVVKLALPPRSDCLFEIVRTRVLEGAVEDERVFDLLSRRSGGGAALVEEIADRSPRAIVRLRATHALAFRSKVAPGRAWKVIQTDAECDPALALETLLLLEEAPPSATIEAIAEAIASAPSERGLDGSRSIDESLKSIFTSTVNRHAARLIIRRALSQDVEATRRAWLERALERMGHTDRSVPVK